VAGLFGLVARTWRYSLRGGEHERDAHQGGSRVIYALWHGRLLPLAFLYRGRGVGALVSRHRDGEYLAGALEHLGFRVCRGSSGHGGAEGLLGMRELARTADLAITPDGPRGPAGEVAPGILTLAQCTGMPIVPVGCVARPAWHLDSWDRFMIPWPFARVEVRYGAAIRVPAELDAAGVDAVGRELVETLARLSEGAPGAPRRGAW
jgi:hypothetical protein